MMQRVQSPQRLPPACDPSLNTRNVVGTSILVTAFFGCILQFEFPASAVQDYLWHSLHLSPECCTSESVLCPCPFTHREWMKEHFPLRILLPGSRLKNFSFLFKCHNNKFPTAAVIQDGSFLCVWQ